MITKVVRLGTDDEIIIKASTVAIDEDTGQEVLTPIPFVANGTNKIDVSFAEQSVNSVDNDDMVSFDNDGNIKLKLGSVSNASKGRNYPAIVTAFSDSYPSGQTICSPDEEDSSLSLIFK